MQIEEKRQGLISIIVPAYNAERTLPRCIESVVSQSYEEWELLIINDGSRDETKRIAAEYSRLDSRVKVFCQQNMGRSIARNKGIQYASGDWITFLDSDDTLPVDSLTTLMRTETILDVDCAWGGYRTGEKIFTCSNNMKCIQDAKNVGLGIIDPGKYAAKIGVGKVESQSALLRSVWGKLYRRSVIVSNRVQFEPGLRFGEDALFNLAYLSFSKSVLLISSPVYEYDLQESSTVTVFNANDGRYLESFIIAANNLLSSFEISWGLKAESKDKFIAMEISSVWWKAATSGEKLKTIKNSIEETFLSDAVQAVLCCNPSIGVLRRVFCRIRFFLIRKKHLTLALIIDSILGKVFACITSSPYERRAKR